MAILQSSLCDWTTDDPRSLIDYAYVYQYQHQLLCVWVFRSMTLPKFAASHKSIIAGKDADNIGEPPLRFRFQQSRPV